MFRSTLILIAAFASSAAANSTLDFADHPLAANSFDNGGPTPNANGFVTGNAHLNNNYSNGFGPYWNGFSLSNVNDTTTPGFENQYASYAGGGVGGTGTYAVAYEDAYNAVKPTIDLPAGTRPTSVQVTNTTYAALTVLDGGTYAGKKFGGASGNDADFFSVTFDGHNAVGGGGASTGSVTFFLADYRFANNAQDYVVKTWTSVDLSSFTAATKSITMSFVSSDNDPTYGIITPTYAAIDNLVLVPEPATLTLLALPLICRRRR